MSSLSKKTFSYKSMSWLLVAAILLIVILPAHYHLHHLHGDNMHSATVDVPAHVFDFHLLIDSAGQSHHNEDAISIVASPDGIVKKSNPVFAPFIFLAIVLVLFPILNKQIKTRIDYKYINLKQSYPHFRPLLRAPPQY
jgi:hypothetical protein